MFLKMVIKLKMESINDLHKLMSPCIIFYSILNPFFTKMNILNNLFKLKLNSTYFL